ncbi:SDR family oxidoreductase [Nocardia sp. NBC_01499]|uniref:glucose 1-dehydrogenase n=1 Tax=Nocardia sp. NBC_01499 TaxID=2903597 RepID=UPI00386AD75F
MGRVQDKVALISGGARGMGAAHARLLASQGAKVVIADILADDGKALADELGDNAAYVQLDVTDPEQWKAAVEAAVQQFGRLDVLVNNAGIAGIAPLAETTPESWRKIIDINLTGTFLGMQAAVPAMLEHGGSIVNISSVEGLRGSQGLHAYVASKFGVRGITKSVALEYARFDVRVNSIHPGFVDTQMTEGLKAEELGIPLGRAAKPAEVSDLVLFLASDEARYCTGSEFVIDGGLTAGLTTQRQS